MKLADIESFKNQTHNRRTLLSICNSMYDPLGLCTPVTIKLKLLMRDSLSVNDPTDWDSPVSSHLIEEWGDTIQDCLSAQQVYFKRSTHPGHAVKLPKIVSFFDGSEQAFSAATYIVWLTFKDEERRVMSLGVGDINDEDFDPSIHEFHSVLLSAKARVSLLRMELTIPR